MVDMPELLWAFQSEGNQRGWLHTKPPQAIIDIPTEYVRADLHAALTEERDRLKDQRDYYKARDEEGERIQAEIEAERDRLAKANAELRELFQQDGEQHASVIRDLTNRHETRITKYAERIKELREANAELLAAFDDLMSWFPDKPTEPMWQMKAGEWGADAAIDEARALLIKHKATSTERDGSSMTGFLATMSEKQKQAAREYQGPDTHGNIAALKGGNDAT